MTSMPPPHAGLPGKLVGVFYSSWFPFPTNWPDTGGCTWGTPLLGYYASGNASVIDAHTDWLVGAGVDFLLFDWSNNCGNVDGDRTTNINLWDIEDNTYAFAQRQIWRRQQGKPTLQFGIFLGTCGDCSNIANGVLDCKVTC